MSHKKHTDLHEKAAVINRDRPNVLPSKVSVSIPNPVTMRQEVSTEDKQRYFEERDDRGKAREIASKSLRAAKTLNVITVLAGIVGILSLWGLYLTIVQSRTAMELDQRAWVNLREDPNPILFYDKPIAANLVAQNIGKTPATDIRGVICFDLVPNNDSLSFDYKNKSSQCWGWTRHLLVPNDTDNFVALSAKKVVADELEGHRNGQIWLAVHGFYTYRDIFNNLKWAKFCKVHTNSQFFNGRSCSEHNSVGDGEPDLTQ